MHWIRRLHLYSGMCMFPWVMLYGITALLFNHPGVFPDHQQVSFGAADTEGTPLQSFPQPADLARKVIAALKNAAARSGETARSYRLVETEPMSYSRDSVFARVNAEGKQHFVRIQIAAGTGEISTRETAVPSPNVPFTQQKLEVEGAPAELVKSSLATVLERRSLPIGDVAITSSPELVFVMESDGKRWRVTYNTQNGNVAGRPADEPQASLSPRSFLLRLHLAHGFPAAINARWLWAIAVDAMFVCMVFWSLSGLLMFWQIKAVRRWGIAMVLLGAVVSAALGFGMHGELAR